MPSVPNLPTTLPQMVPDMLYGALIPIPPSSRNLSEPGQYVSAVTPPRAPLAPIWPAANLCPPGLRWESSALSLKETRVLPFSLSLSFLPHPLTHTLLNHHHIETL